MALAQHGLWSCSARDHLEVRSRMLETLLQVVLYCACLCLGGSFAPAFPLPCAACAYCLVLARARLRPMVHFQHCRAWTLLVVAVATPLCGTGGWSLVLGLLVLCFCPAMFLWWPGKRPLADSKVADLAKRTVRWQRSLRGEVRMPGKTAQASGAEKGLAREWGR